MTDPASLTDEDLDELEHLVCRGLHVFSEEVLAIIANLRAARAEVERLREERGQMVEALVDVGGELADHWNVGRD